MAQTNQRLALQIVVALLTTIPIFVGLTGILGGPKILEKTYKSSIPLDSHFRYLSGLLLGIGLLVLRSLPTIDRDGSDLRRVTLLVFIGGLGRLWGFITAGYSFDAVIGLFIELFIVPLVSLWQYRIQEQTIQSRTK